MAPLLLLVDDAPEIAVIIRLLGRRCGHEIACHPGGAAALTWLRTAPRRPDLLLLDLKLPGEGGIEVYQMLCRESESARGVPAALFTQAASPAQLARAIDAGIDFLVGKELVARPDDWKQRIDEVLATAADLRALDPSSPLPRFGGEGSGVRGKDEATRVAEVIAKALQHPALAPLQEAVDAVWRAAFRRAIRGLSTGEVRVDIPASSANVSSCVAALVASRPDFLARLVRCLGSQIEGLLGRTASEPVRAALALALGQSGG